MGARVSFRSNDSSANNQSEDQAIAALLLVISKNVISMEQLINQIDTCEDIEQLKNQLNDIQNHILKLIEDATTDIEQLATANLGNSELGRPHRKLQKGRQKEQFQNELTAAVEKFQSMQKLAAEKEENMIRKTKQEIKNESKYISALILTISKQVNSMKQIIHQLTNSSKDTEELLNKLDEIDHYTGLLIDDASDCIKKQAQSLVPSGSNSSPNHDRHQELNADDVSLLREIGDLLLSLKMLDTKLEMLDTEKKNVMMKVIEFKIQHRKKNEM